MKTFKNFPENYSQRFKGVLTIFSIVILFFVSCTKQNKLEGGPGSYVLFVNAVPKNNSVDFFLNNQRVNTQSLSFGAGLDYLNVTPGDAKLDLTFGNVQVVASANTTINEGKYYSVFATGKSPVEFVVTEDDRTAPTLGKGKVRFVQLSPDAPNMSIDIESTPNLFSDRAYKSYTDFIPVDAGNYTFKVRQTGSNTVKFSKFDVQIDGGGLYTVMVIGLWSGAVTEPPLDIKVIKNK
jgi:hypothetical protein